MVRLRRPEPYDVLTGARTRLDQALTLFDRLVVMFSGGKDSLACLHLVREAQLRAGDDRPVLAVHRDMEFVNASVVQKVTEVHDGYEWVDLRWWALPWQARTVVFGEPVELLTWDPARPWHRQPPEYAWRGDGGLYDPERADLAAVALHPGRVGLVTGVRAAESLIRYRAAVNKLSQPWLTAGGAKGVSTVKPMYDWQEGDVLRYLYDSGDTPCDLYDAQAWAGKGQLRTSSLASAEAMRDLHTLLVTDPDAYALVLDTFPGADLARRYSHDLADRHRIGTEATTWAELETWIYERFQDQPAGLDTALMRLDFANRLRAKNPDGFPPWWVQKEIARMGHDKGLLPLPKTHPRYQEAPRG